jgi:hypothetical protein
VPKPALAVSRPPSDLELRQKAEAGEMLKEAEALLTKPRFALFWAPDYVKAAPLFEKAAHKLQAARLWGDALEALLRAADCQAKEKYTVHASTNLRKCADLAVKLGDGARAAAILRQVAAALVESGDRQRAAEAIVAAAKLSARPDARGLFREACDLVYDGSEPADGVKFAATAHEVFGETVDFFLAGGELGEARRAYPRYLAVLQANGLGPTLHKAYLCQSILELEAGDPVKAYALFMEHLQDSDYLRTDECKCEEDLISSIRRGKSKELAAAQAIGCVAYLPRAVQAAARALAVTDEADDAAADDDDGASDAGGAAADSDEDLQASALDPTPAPSQPPAPVPVPVPTPAVAPAAAPAAATAVVTAAAAVSAAAPVAKAAAAAAEEDEEDDEDLT